MYLKVKNIHHYYITWWNKSAYTLVTRPPVFRPRTWLRPSTSCLVYEWRSGTFLQSGLYGVYLIYGMNYGMDWWNGISANQNCQNSPLWPWRSCKCCLAIARFHWTVMSSLCFLASYPAHAWNVQCVDEAMFWQCGCQVMCVLIGTSL